MIKNIFLFLVSLSLGISTGVIFIFLFPAANSTLSIPLSRKTIAAKQKQVIGFLPYWLLDKAKTDYSGYLTTLSYFALRIGSDGKIQKLTSPTEEEPGWYALESGKVDPFLASARKNNIGLSLVVNSGDNGAISSIIENPVNNGKNLVKDIIPIMSKYGFSDLNLDIEYTQDASISSRQKFTLFIKTVRENLPIDKSITVEISPIDVVSQRIIDTYSISQFVTRIVLMAYDYHSPDSLVTGPVAPLYGAGDKLEYDVNATVQKTLGFVNQGRLILGIPLYGYEWEILGATPHSAIIPGSGVLASNNRASIMLSKCQTCSLQYDNQSGESYIFYKSDQTNTNHLIYFPDIKSTGAKIAFADKNNLEGVALWAMGYEGDTILNPISSYKKN